jgi:hypothetical protein
MISNIPTTQLWIGQHEALVQKVYDYATTLFGSEKNALIVDRQFHRIRWFYPEKNQYTKAELESVFYQTSFALDPEEYQIIIFEQADTFSTSCANMLLKLLEEPPIGYHFILLAQRLDAILPTIQSRSVITDFGFQQKESFDAFLNFFKNPVSGNHLQIMQEFERAKITEYQTRLLIDQLIAYWSREHIQALQRSDTGAVKRSDRMLRICQHALDYPPMPGSTKIFWRNIYLFMSL